MTQRSWIQYMFVAVLTACWVGCTPPVGENDTSTASPGTTEPRAYPGTTLPMASPGMTEPATSHRVFPSRAPQVVVKLDCPEEVKGGQEFTAQLTVENCTPSVMAGLLVTARFGDQLEQIGNAGELVRKLDDLPPGQMQQIEVALRAAKPGTASCTAEVTRNGRVLASDWTTITVKGEPKRVTMDEPPVELPADVVPDLGPPLVDSPDALQRLHPSDPIWFDAGGRRVIMIGTVCRREAPLELFACLTGSKEHESILSVRTKAYVVHAGLMAAGAEPGSPVKFDPEFSPPSGPEIDVQVVWQDEKGERHSARAQDWVRNGQTGKAMTAPWVFTGSRFYVNKTTGERFYAADVDGDLICLSNFSSAVLDVPMASSDANADLLFTCFTENIPPLGTPVTLVLTLKEG